MQFSTASIPALPSLGLSEQEKATIWQLGQAALSSRADMLLTEAYYLGEQVVKNLRIAVPAELEFLKAAMGWPAKAVDPYVARLSADCFRVPTATDGDQTIADIMAANGFAAEQSLAFNDALVLGRSYWSVGSPVENGGPPQVTVDSPLTTSVLWDLRGLNPKAALQQYYSEGRHHGVLLLPRMTVHLATDDSGQWVVADRDEHGFDFVPIVRMAHQPRTKDRDGRSAITPAMKYFTDAACRTLLGLEVAREIYSVPQKVILGAAEDAFVKSDGTAASAWDTYITKTLGLERDENGDLPEIKQMQPYDPSVFTKLLDYYAATVAGMVLSPPQDMGLYTQGNPASADSVVAMNSERDLHSIQMQNQFGVPLAKVAQYALRFENKGRLPKGYEQLAVDWNPVSLPNPGVTSDAVTKEVAAGAVPATSDVVLKRLGYSQVERTRLEQDRKRADGRQAAKDIAASLIPPAPQPGSASGNPAAGQ